MLDNVVDSIKQMIGISPEDTSFDMNIIMCINSALAVMSDIGIEEVDDIVLTDNSMTWDDLLGGRTDIEYAKSYIALKVKLLFDPPSSSAAMDAINKQIAEYEWRLSIK